MKQHEQAELWLRKAARDEETLSLLGEAGSDEVWGFHAQQAAEKLLKAVLSLRGVRIQKTHDLEALADAVQASGLVVPGETDWLGMLTDFGTVYRYEEYERAVGLDRTEVRQSLKQMRGWAERVIGPPDEPE